MDVKTYNEILDVIKNYSGLSKNCLKLLTGRFKCVSPDCLYSIFSREYQQRMKINHVKNESTKNRYYSLYRNAIENGESPGIILRISEQFDVTPCLVAKLILQKFLEDCDKTDSNEQPQMSLNTYLRDTSLINDMDLSYEIYLCTIYDIFYSPLSETMKHSLGQQYEVKLQHEVMALGLACRDEEHLRKSGYDKTPDVKLEVPVAMEGFVINWIESKALFGTPEAHKDYMKNQYLSYWNRFGPGLVIYWFGYLATIVEPNDKRFIIRDHLPKDVVYLTPQNMQ